MNLWAFLTLLTIGYVCGRWLEKRHYNSIHKREKLHRNIILLPDRIPPVELMNHESQLVTGAVVISVDYFKVISASLRNLFGGRVKSYESLLDRARREATLRMQEQAQLLHANTIYNVRYETSRIGENAGGGLGSIEVMAYGTALFKP